LVKEEKFVSLWASYSAVGYAPREHLDNENGSFLRSQNPENVEEGEVMTSRTTICL
jgi:hypothetical protein